MRTQHLKKLILWINHLLQFWIQKILILNQLLHCHQTLQVNVNSKYMFFINIQSINNNIIIDIVEDNLDSLLKTLNKDSSLINSNINESNSVNKGTVFTIIIYFY